MRINPCKFSNYISFSKEPVSACVLINKDKGTKSDATLYKADVKSDSDKFDIKRSKTASCLYSDFMRERRRNEPCSDFFILQDDKTNEVICAAETSRHYRPLEGKKEGFATIIDEIRENNKYENAAEPMLEYIVREAYKRGDTNVFTAFQSEDLPSLKRERFTETNNGEWYMPRARFFDFIDIAEKRSHIDYFE